MKLRAVRVWNYRSIVDSGFVEVTDRVTVLIGKNEQGKTTFLRALLSFNTQIIYTSADLPTHLRAQLEEANPAEIQMVRLWLSVERVDQDRLRKHVPDVSLIDEFVVTKYFDGHYTYVASMPGVGENLPVNFAVPATKPYSDAMINEAEALRGKLETHAARVTAFAPSKQQAEAHINQFVSSNFEDRAITL